MKTCGKPVRCWDLNVRPCVRHEGHTPNLHNPFSPEHPFEMAPVTKVEDSPQVKLFKQVLAVAEVLAK